MVEVNSQKGEIHTITKYYQLTTSQSKEKQFYAGGNVGLSVSFFNVGGVGVGVDANYTRTNEKRGEQQYGEGKSAQLGKSYGIVATVQIPPKTKLIINFTTHVIP